MARVKNNDTLIGERFGRLTVTEQDGKRGARRLWVCLCDCGSTTRAVTSNLKFGSVRSCGCLLKEITSARSKTHGGRDTRLYGIWRGMKKRCTLPGGAYKHYYGRGITVCDEWLSSFVAFRDWALANGYADELTLDRIDNNGDYEPGNCRWATYRTQIINSRTILRTSDGQPAVLVAALNGINRSTFYYRRYAGWSVDDAASIVPTHKNRHDRFKRYASWPQGPDAEPSEEAK